MEDFSELSGAINRATKFTIRALKRNDHDAAFNSLKALVNMHIRMHNQQKALEIIKLAKDIFSDF